MIEAMERIMRNICLALILALALSCGKEVAEPSEKTWMSSDYECVHAFLEHHAAVPATYDTRGNVEYWSCTQCGKRFSDADGQKEYNGRIYLLPKKFVDASCLSGYDPFPKSGTKDGITAATVASIASLLVTIGGLTTTCISYCDDCEEVVDEINEVTNKAEKNADDLALLEYLSEKMSEDVKSFNREMDEMAVKVDEMIHNINESNEILQNTRQSLVKSLEEVSLVENNIRLYNLFDTRYRDIVSLDTSTSCAWEAVWSLLSKGGDQLASARTARDSAEVLISKTKQIENVVSAWGADWSCPNKTSALISRYLQMDADYGSTFVKLLDDYSTDHFVWEHQTIQFKQLILDYDFTVLSQAYTLARVYYAMVPDVDKTYYQYRFEALKALFDEMTGLAVEKSQEYELAYNSDRVCRATGKIFAIDAVEAYPEEFLLSYAKSVSETGDVFRDHFWEIYRIADTKEETRERAIDDYDLELFCAASASSSLWEICFVGMGFHKDFESDKPAAIMVPFGEKEYSLTISNKPIYKTKASFNETYFDVKSNCRVDGVVTKKLFLGEYKYTKSEKSSTVVVKPDSYRYFTFKVVGNKEAEQ